MANDPGNAPTLQREDLQGVAETNRGVIYERFFPVSQLFMLGGGGDLILSSSRKILIDVERAMRRLGKWHSSPGDGDPLEYVRIGLKAAQVAYKLVTDQLEPDHAAILRSPGEAQLGMADPGFIRANAEAAALRWLNKFLMSGTRQHLRDFEQICINLLSTASFNWNIDGYNKPVTTGLTMLPAPGGKAWTDAAADIPADMAAMLVAFITSAGAPPDVIIYSYQLMTELGKNTTVRAVVNSGREFHLPITDLPLDILPSELREATLIKHTDIIDGTVASDTADGPVKTAMWGHYKVTMLSLRDDPEDVCRAYTVGTKPDGYQGGLFTSVIETGHQQVTEAGVGFNAAPVTIDTERIMCWDVSTT